jgi:hypothetical protein
MCDPYFSVLAFFGYMSITFHEFFFHACPLRPVNIREFSRRRGWPSAAQKIELAEREIKSHERAGFANKKFRQTAQNGRPVWIPSRPVDFFQSAAPVSPPFLA